MANNNRAGSRILRTLCHAQFSDEKLAQSDVNIIMENHPDEIDAFRG